MGDSKILKELAGQDESKIEFSIMVIGGAAALDAKTEVPGDNKVAQGASGKEVLATDEFWVDLKGFLVQRLRDEAEGERLFSTFRKAYDS